MLCPDCKKEVEPSRGDPQISRVGMSGRVVHATSEIGDICSECFRLLQSGKTEVERDLGGVPSLKAHLQHKWRAELLKAERIPDPSDYATTKIFYRVVCECERSPTHEGTLLCSAKFSPAP